MQVLEVTAKKHQKQQLDEVVPFLAYAAGTLVLNFLGGLAIDQVAKGIKNWQDDLAIKNYKSTGNHIPDKTIINDGKLRYVYDEKSGKWGVQEKSGRKWKYKMQVAKAGAQPTYITKNVTADMMKKAIKNKKLSFSNKAAVVRTMQAQFTANNPKAAAAFQNSGNYLQDIIDKEEGNLSKSGKARMKTGKQRWGAFGRIANGIMSRRAFQAISFLVPMALVINGVRLKMWYEYKLNYDKADDLSMDANNEGRAGWPTVRDDGSVTPYNNQDYDKDIIALRTYLTNGCMAWIVAGGVNAFVGGIMWMLQFRKHKIIDKLEKGQYSKGITNFFKRVASGFGGLIGKGIKIAGIGIGAGLVYGAFDRKFAEKVAGHMSEWILTVDPNRTHTGEALATYIIDAIFDEGSGEAMYRQIGLGTTADNTLDRAKDDLDMSPDDNDTSLSMDPGASGSSIDQVTKGDDFWSK